MKNVVVMTSGLAGSSVLTGLVSQAGYWTGDQTAKKSDYDTYENRRLIELNQALFDSVEFDGEYTTIFPGWVIDAIAAKIDKIDAAPFKEFIAECERNKPWIWKDPRLSLTIHAWARWLNLDDIRFLMISREAKQSWISVTLRRQIQTFSYHAAYNDRVRRAHQSFFDQYALGHLPIVYEELIIRPEETLESLNRYLNAELKMSDLEAVYSRQLYQRHHGARSLFKAVLIYLKNYRERHFVDHAP